MRTNKRAGTIYCTLIARVSTVHWFILYIHMYVNTNMHTCDENERRKEKKIRKKKDNVRLLCKLSASEYDLRCRCVDIKRLSRLNGNLTKINLDRETARDYAGINGS